MEKSLEKYEAAIDKLISEGELLYLSMKYSCYEEATKLQLFNSYKSLLENEKNGQVSKEEVDHAVTEHLKNYKNFGSRYQSWYSESHALVKQLIPSRLNDFVRLYEKPKNRKSIDCGNYVMEDYLQGIKVSFGAEVKVDRAAAIPQFRQQVDIVKAVRSRLGSVLYDIKQLVQADLFDTELASARELLKKKFFRAAGAICGVVLEKHLSQVADNHQLQSSKKHPALNDWFSLLKEADVIDIPLWRKMQHLADIRNICDHSTGKEPTVDQIEELIAGVEKISKTLY